MADIRRRLLPQKSDFLPDRSFENMKTYKSALLEIPHRFRERFFARADVNDEVFQLRIRSRNDMKRTLNWWDLGWFAVGAVMGAGIFVLTGQEAHNSAGPAIVISFALAGLSAMLSVLCYTEFSVEIPVAGGSFAYLRVELGDFIAFIAAGNIILDCLIGTAAIARSWTSHFATLLNYEPNQLRIHTNLMTNYNLLDPIAVLVLIIAGLLGIWSTRKASFFNWIASGLTMLIILFVIIAGLANAKASNYTPFMPYGVRGVFKAASVLFYAYLGFDAVCTLAEETKNPKRDIPIGLIASMSVITLLYCLMAVTLCLMQKYTDIDTDAPFSSAFSSVAGWKWAQYVVGLGALKGMTTVLLVGIVGQARYVTHIARTHLIPPWFALVNERTGTPVNSTAVMVLGSSVIAFFTSLSILANLLSISTLIIFMLVALSLLVRRYYVKDKTTKKQQCFFIFFLIVILGSSLALAIYWVLSDGWLGFVITVPVWFLGTFGLAVFIPKAREPDVWGVPFVPWVPSLSIAINIFLLASLDKDSFIRFGVWTAVMIVYYIFFGLHASYDAAHEPKSNNVSGYTKVDGGGDKEIISGKGAAAEGMEGSDDVTMMVGLLMQVG